MMDIQPHERQAIAATMIPLAEYLTELGWDTRFSDLSEQQVFQLINVVVGGYQADMAQQMKEIPF